MSGRPARVVLLPIAWSTLCAVVCALSVSPRSEVSRPHVHSPLFRAQAKTTSEPDIKITELKFEGNTLLPLADQDEIAASIKNASYTRGSKGFIDEVLERARLGWEDCGYLNVEVSERGTKVLASSPASQRVAVVLHVDEGRQYHLKDITFRNNWILKDVKTLRSLFPIADGEIFSRDKISQGLELLRKAYGELGYVNFTSYPDTEVDESSSAISLAIDVDEGKLFHVGRLEILGLNQQDLRQALNDLALKPGDVYKWDRIESFLIKHHLPGDKRSGTRFESHMDEESGTISLLFDFRTASTN